MDETKLSLLSCMVAQPLVTSSHDSVRVTAVEFTDNAPELITILLLMGLACRMAPPIPTVTKAELPYVTPLRSYDVRDVLVFHVEPSDDVSIAPADPTATKVESA